MSAVAAGADGITAHLREDRRHIRDADMERLRREIDRPLNFEMAVTDEMMGIVLHFRPHAACLVPEKREERTTEGGLDIVGGREHLAPAIARLNEAGVRVSLFVEPEIHVMEAARALAAPVVELHTGTYCEAVIEGDAARIRAELARLARAAEHGSALGLEIHCRPRPHPRQRRPGGGPAPVRELNIGHALVAEAIFDGLAPAIRAMRAAMDAARPGTAA